MNILSQPALSEKQEVGTGEATADTRGGLRAGKIRCSARL